MDFLGAHLGAHGMTRATCGLNNNMLRQILRAFRRETELDQKIRNISLVSLGRGIFLGNDCIQLALAVFAVRTKAVVPDIKSSNGSTGPRSRSICWRNSRLISCMWPP